MHLTHMPCAQDPWGGPPQLLLSWRTPCPEAGLPSLGLTDEETEARRRPWLSQRPGHHMLGGLLLGKDGLGWLSEGVGSPWGDHTQWAKPGAVSHEPLDDLPFEAPQPQFTATTGVQPCTHPTLALGWQG